MVFAVGVVMAACHHDTPAEQVWPSQIGPPDEVQTLHSGMTVEEAERAVPGLTEGSDGLRLAVGSDKQVEVLAVLDAVKRVGEIVVTYPGCHETPQSVAAHWGIANARGIINTSNDSASWFDEKSGWYAAFKVDMNGACIVRSLHRDYLGKAPAPLSDLANVRQHMSRADALRVAPRMIDQGMVPLTGLHSLRGAVAIDPETHAVSGSSVTVPLDLTQIFTSAWGEPTPDPHDPSSVRWLSPSPGWKADLVTDEAFAVLDISEYLSVEDWLGAGDPIAQLDESVLGSTSAQLHERFGSRYRDDPNTTAPSGELQAPAMTWDRNVYSRVGVWYGEDHAAESVVFSIEYEPPATGAAVLELLARKWPQPTSNGITTVFSSPTYGRIEAYDDGLFVQITIHQKPTARKRNHAALGAIR